MLTSIQNQRPQSPDAAQPIALSIPEVSVTPDSSPTDQPSSPDANRLAPSQASQSLDGDTLRSRSDSFNSGAETVRSRANSEAGPEAANAEKSKDKQSKEKEPYDDVPLSEALNPDLRAEQDFHVDDNRFAFSPGQLNKLLNPKSLSAFEALGGMRGLARGLRTDPASGLSVDEGRLDGTVTFEEATSSPDSQSKQDQSAPGPSASGSGSQFEDRIRIFSQNRLPAKKSAGIFKLLWLAYNDKFMILLTIAAVISLALGIYETASTGHGVQWIEGVAICVAISIVTIVTAANDWQKERQFKKLNKRVSSS